MKNEPVGSSGAAEILGVPPGEIKRIVRDQPFPEPVAWLEGRRAWLRRDIEAFRDRQPRPDREPGESQDHVLNAAEAAAVLGIGPRHLRRCVQRARWDLVPHPGGRIGLALYWWRDGIDEWRREHSGSSKGS